MYQMKLNGFKQNQDLYLQEPIKLQDFKKKLDILPGINNSIQILMGYRNLNTIQDTSPKVKTKLQYTCICKELLIRILIKYW